eukprot:1606855-Rhodomonas_salina.2
MWHMLLPEVQVQDLGGYYDPRYHATTPLRHVRNKVEQSGVPIRIEVVAGTPNTELGTNSVLLRYSEMGIARFSGLRFLNASKNAQLRYEEKKKKVEKGRLAWCLRSDLDPTALIDRPGIATTSCLRARYAMSGSEVWYDPPRTSPVLTRAMHLPVQVDSVPFDISLVPASLEIVTSPGRVPYQPTHVLGDTGTDIAFGITWYPALASSIVLCRTKYGRIVRYYALVGTKIVYCATRLCQHSRYSSISAASSKAVGC